MPNYVGKFLINEGSVQINDVYEYQHYGSISPDHDLSTAGN